ncbi:unnamed protein product, partial [Didymodactylos carnosus]
MSHYYKKSKLGASESDEIAISDYYSILPNSKDNGLDQQHIDLNGKISNQNEELRTISQILTSNLQQVPSLNSPNSQSSTDNSFQSTINAENDYIDAAQTSYEEIASVVSNKDEPLIMCFTFRTWILGLFFTVFISCINRYGYYRTTSFYFVPILVLLYSYCLGKSLSFILPKRLFFIWSKKFEFSLNPQPFAIKEHVLICVMAFAAYTPSVIDIIVIQRVFYQKQISFLIAIILIISSNLMGYSVA